MSYRYMELTLLSEGCLLASSLVLSLSPISPTIKLSQPTTTEQNTIYFQQPSCSDHLASTQLSTVAIALLCTCSCSCYCLCEPPRRRDSRTQLVVALERIIFHIPIHQVITPLTLLHSKLVVSKIQRQLCPLAPSFPPSLSRSWAKVAGLNLHLRSTPRQLRHQSFHLLSSITFSCLAQSTLEIGTASTLSHWLFTSLYHCLLPSCRGCFACSTLETGTASTLSVLLPSLPHFITSPCLSTVVTRINSKINLYSVNFVSFSSLA